MRIYSSTKTLPCLGHTIAVNREISRLSMPPLLVGCIDVAGGTSASNEEGDTTTRIGAGVVGKANGGKGG